MAAGTFVTKAVLLLQITPAAAGSGNSDVVMTRPFVAYDCHNIATVTDGGSTMQVSRQALGSGGFNTVTNAMACAAADALTRTTTMTQAQCTLSTTDVVRVILTTGGAGTCNGLCFLHVYPTALP